MTQDEFSKAAKMDKRYNGISGVEIPVGDMQVSALAFEYITLNFRWVENIKEKQSATVIHFQNDIEADSFFEYIKGNLPIS